MQNKGIIFDLDGVLVDTTRHHQIAWAQMADQLGIPYPENAVELMAGLSRSECLDVLLEKGKVYLTDAEKLFWADLKNNWYIKMIEELKPEDLLAGVKPFLQTCSEEGIRMAVVSGSKNAKTVLESVGIIAYFQFIVDGTMVKKNKPDPDRYRFAAHMLECDLANAWVIEDSLIGIQGARMAGFKTVFIGKTNEKPEAELHIQRLDSLQPGMLFSVLDNLAHQQSSQS